MEAAIRSLAAVLTRASSLLWGISLSYHFHCYSAFFFLWVIPFSVFSSLTLFQSVFFSLSQFHSPLFYWKRVFVSPSVPRWYRHSLIPVSVQFNWVQFVGGNMKREQFGKVQVNPQILYCIFLSWSFPSCLTGDLSRTTIKFSPVLVLCVVCMYVCFCVILWLE